MTDATPDAAPLTERLIDDPAAALFFADGYQVRYLQLFLPQERSLAEAARSLAVSKSRMSYWVKKMLALGLIRVVRVEKRGRYFVPVYRATADVFLIPLELLPAESDEALLAMHSADFVKHERRSLACFGRRHADGWHVRYAARGDRGQLSIVPRSGDMEDAEIFNVWGQLSLSEAAAGALRQDMKTLLEGYLEKPSSGEKRYLFKLLLVEKWPEPS